jgi:predicted esterase
MPLPRWKTIRRIWIITGLTAAVLFNGWMLLGRRAVIDESVLDSTDRVTVTETHERITFTPRTPAQSGLIFFPGGTVAPRAYAPLCRAIAESGHEAVIVKMPFRWALFEFQKQTTLNRALATMQQTPRRWVVSGHSLGGALASRFAHEHGDKIAGLVLLGTTHPVELDLSRATYPVTKLYATNDRIAKQEKVEANRARLPAHTRWLRIDGGNHVQFGYYAGQPGDGDATISHERQQEIVRDAIGVILSRADGEGSPDRAP